MAEISKKFKALNSKLNDRIRRMQKQKPKPKWKQRQGLKTNPKKVSNTKEQKTVITAPRGIYPYFSKEETKKADNTSNQNNNKEEKKHSLIAISGMPGAGKTSVSSRLVSTIPNLVYFDFGAFFRPITYYLIKEKGKSIDDLKKIIEESKIEELMKELNLGHKNSNGAYEVSVDGKFFKEEELYNPEMDRLTVEVGTCFGDNLNEYIRNIIEDIRKKNPVLLNARRPFSVCQDISNHIFLKANFHKRAERKAELEGTSLEQAVENLRRRDEKESKAGFWEVFPFTKVIDTTNMEVETATELVMKHILGYSIKRENRDEEVEETRK